MEKVPHFLSFALLTSVRRRCIARTTRNSATPHVAAAPCGVHNVCAHRPNGELARCRSRAVLSWSIENFRNALSLRISLPKRAHESLGTCIASRVSAPVSHTRCGASRSLYDSSLCVAQRCRERLRLRSIYENTSMQSSYTLLCAPNCFLLPDRQCCAANGRRSPLDTFKEDSFHCPKPLNAPINVLIFVHGVQLEFKAELKPLMHSQKRVIEQEVAARVRAHLRESVSVAFILGTFLICVRNAHLVVLKE